MGLNISLTNSIIIEFLYGVLAAELLDRFGPLLSRNNVSRWLPVTLMVIGGAALLSTVAFQVTDSQRFIFYGIPALFIVFGAATAGARPAPRLLTYLEDASYSIYLVHDFFAMAYASALKHHPWIGVVPSDPTILIGAVVTITCSSLTYPLVERPLTALLSRRGRDRKNVVAATPDSVVA